MFDTLKEDIQCVFERDPAARNAFEVLTNYPGLHATLLHRMGHNLWNAGFKWLARTLSSFSRLLTGIEIHPGAQIGRRFLIDHGMGVVIGETAEVGNDCTLYQGVTLGGTSWDKGKRHPTLASNVVVGAGAKVLGPIQIGQGARIGSNAVVVKDVPEGATVVGIPGHVVKQKSARARSREAMAEKMGFDAYGMTRDLPDPVEHAINRMLDHMEATDQKMDRMCETIRGLGGDVENVRLPTLDEAKMEPNYGKNGPPKKRRGKNT